MPGSGKSTQGKLLSEKINIPWVSIGELLREEFRKKTKDGIEANKFTSKGLNCPTEIKIRILEKILLNSKSGFILDNYPRTVDDLNHLKEFIEKAKIKIDFAFLLKTSQGEVIDRLVKKGQMDPDGSKRNDSSISQIKTRINKGFMEDAKIILDYFFSQKILQEINGEQEMEKVHEDIMQVLKIK